MKLDTIVLVAIAAVDNALAVPLKTSDTKPAMGKRQQFGPRSYAPSYIGAEDPAMEKRQQYGPWSYAPTYIGAEHPAMEED
ncbi:hypothetical protein CBER1_11756 [Cercospora berteroae]|uniref:Uncharacterized protein n=1 Tax=Cercospora berteroae TaxID=357750 RepID=A0A2S6CLH7_9PEZI|nr:hypothetical protein CBER1_11756 [Cercospora berteroae]